MNLFCHSEESHWDDEESHKLSCETLRFPQGDGST